jgi:hypothetical protein
MLGNIPPKIVGILRGIIGCPYILPKGLREEIIDKS